MAALTVLAGVSGAAAGAGGNLKGPVPAQQRLPVPNGLRLILVPRHDIPLVAFDLLRGGGARLDPPGRAGTATLVADLLTHGAGARDAYAFADAVEGAGGFFDAEAREEAIQVRGQFLARDSHLMLQLLGDAVLRPHFAPEELESLRTRRIEGLKAGKASAPQSLLPSYGRALLFAGHPYGRPVGGSEQSLAQITRAQLSAYYAAQAGADRATLVIAGDFDPARISREVTALFGAWPRAAGKLAPLPDPPRVHGRRVLLEDAPGSAQTYLWLGNVGVPRRYAPRAALNISSTA